MPTADGGVLLGHCWSTRVGPPLHRRGITCWTLVGPPLDRHWATVRPPPVGPPLGHPCWTTVGPPIAVKPCEGMLS
eukprot:3622256-Pyramimonas_sp.AAC.1